MKVLVIKPGLAPYTQDVDNTLDSLQDIVMENDCRYIELFYPFNDSVVCICNEEGKLYPFFEPNRAILDDYGRVQDVVCGTMVITGISDVDGDLTSLTDEQIDRYTDHFYYANRFSINHDGNIGFEKIEPEQSELEESMEVGGI